MKVETAA